jgi:Asp-tRNA(Asn)/Glu-tRNA(Gln) amidotransferase A subunit family amidase
MSIPWTQAGLPAVCLPAGRDVRSVAGLPMGLQVAGRWQEDEALLAWARGIAEAVAS